jgi:hypothetical protein
MTSAGSLSAEVLANARAWSLIVGVGVAMTVSRWIDWIDSSRKLHKVWIVNSKIGSLDR